MRTLIIILSLLTITAHLHAQYVYTIKADSVKITNCDSAELILENHTQNIPGFLFNTGNGRTVFQRGAIKLSSNMYLVGGDTITIPQVSSNYWSLNGNANIDPSTQFIGTTDATPLVFRIGGAEQMRLMPSTNLGIGTYGNDNGFKLQVNGTTYGLYAAGSQHVIGNLAITSGVDAGVTGNLGLRADVTNGSSLWLEGSNVATAMFVFTTAYGNIPVSVTNSDHNLITVQSGFTDANIPNLNATTLNLQPSYNFTTNSYPVTLRGIYYNPVIGSMQGSRNISIETVTGDALFGTTSGNMGIGTNSPTAQLHTTGSVRFAGLTQDSTQTNVLVSDANGNLYYRSAASLATDNLLRTSLAVNGPIRATKLTLAGDPAWPDYVFDSGYQLKPLSAVESYFKKEHHLAGIPSVADIKEQGLDVGANQAALLKKIEELTLYAVNQDKTLAEQKSEIEMLKGEVCQLKKMIQSKYSK